jgi:DNA-binding NtrC family response regulator
MLPTLYTSTSTVSESRVHAILVVEDEDPIRMCIMEFLQDCGHGVVEAANVAQARNVLATRPVDLVFSDINMPGGETGFALEKWVRRHYPTTKVLLTSGYPHGFADTSELLEPMIPKPYTFSLVLQRIHRLFRTENSGHH